MGRIWLAALAILAVCSTAAATACLGMLSSHLSTLPSVRATAISAAALQSTLLIILSWFISAHALVKIRELSRPFAGVAFCLAVLASLTSLAAGVLTLVWLRTSASDNTPDLSNRSPMVIAVAVMLAVAVTSQTAFMAIHFAQSHHQKSGWRNAFGKKEASWSSTAHIKSIRYSQTMTRTSDSEESASVGLKDTPPSLRNKFVLTSPLNLAFPQAIRHTSSRTRLLHAKDSAQSLATQASMNPNATQESFDTWDTSSVDIRNRQAVMEATSPPATRTYNLETIPASPRASICPENILSIVPPPRSIPKRSRSHSPGTMRGELRRPVPTSPASELHIHPLFRSDSPITPPILSPGTRVIAALNSGQVLAQYPPPRPFPRVRSGSLPSMSRPAFGQQFVSDIVDDKSSGALDVPPVQERKMTPPVPEWILNSKVPPIPRKASGRRSLQTPML